MRDYHNNMYQIPLQTRRKEIRKRHTGVSPEAYITLRCYVDLAVTASPLFHIKLFSHARSKRQHQTGCHQHPTRKN